MESPANFLGGTTKSMAHEVAGYRMDALTYAAVGRYF